MESTNIISPMSMHMSMKCLVVSLGAALDDQLLVQGQKSILDKIYVDGVRGLIIDLSAVPVIDSLNMKMLCDMASMAKLLGATSIFTGLRPGVVSALIDLDLDLGDIQTTVTLDDALQTLRPIITPNIDGEHGGEAGEGDVPTEDDENLKEEAVLEEEALYAQE